MIFTAQVRVLTPGSEWAREMQTRRLTIPADEEGYAIYCEKGSVRVWTLSNNEIDPQAELGYEFVTYDDQRGLIVIAVFVGDGTNPANLGFDALFGDSFQPRRKYDDWAFLIVPTSKRRVKSWAVAPTDGDAYRGTSLTVDPAYINRLIREVRL